MAVSDTHAYKTHSRSSEAHETHFCSPGSSAGTFHSDADFSQTSFLFLSLSLSPLRLTHFLTPTEQCYTTAQREAIPKLKIATIQGLGEHEDAPYQKTTPKRDTIRDATALPQDIDQLDGSGLRYCGVDGKTCWLKVKRDALPATVGEGVDASDSRFCCRYGVTCWVKVRRSSG